MLIPCQVCGKLFPKKPGRPGSKGNKVCSEECRRKSITLSKLKGKYVSCHYCGKQVWKKPYALKRSKLHFCSSECMLAWKKANTIKKPCLYCGKLFTVIDARKDAAKFCSVKCRNLSERDRVTVNCVICNTPFEVIKCRENTAKVCSPECYKRYFLEVVKFNRKSNGTKPELLFDKNTPANINRTSDGKYFVNFHNGKIKNPDFIVRPVNKTKKVIEIFGAYWHPPEEEAKLIALYKEAGYDCLVIWDYEVYDNSYHEKLAKFLNH